MRPTEHDLDRDILVLATVIDRRPEANKWGPPMIEIKATGYTGPATMTKLYDSDEWDTADATEVWALLEAMHAAALGGQETAYVEADVALRTILGIPGVWR